MFNSCLYFTKSATGGALAAGTILGWTSPTQPLIVQSSEAGDFHGQYAFHVDEETWSWVGSSTTLGAAAMCVLIGTIINMFGRKLTMLALVVPFVVGWALVTWAVNVPMLLIGRILLGIAGGAFCVTAPTYTGEIAQPDIRGTLGSYFQLMLTVGILFVYVLGLADSLFVLNIVCLFVPIVFGVVFTLMPETPQYLVSKGRTEAAVKSLQWLRGSAYDYSGELQAMQTEHAEKQAQQTSQVAGLMRKASVRALGISFGLMFFQQLSGINVVIFYTNDIFKEAKVNIDSNIATIIVGVMQVVATFASTLVVDRAGRRILLLLSTGVMGLCTILLGVFFTLKDQDEDSVANIGWLPIVAMCVFILMFSLGFGPIPWMMIGELFAPDVKGVASSMAGAFNWILAFVVTKTFVNIKDAMGTGPTFFMFSAISLLGLVFVFFVVPETKGLSLANVQKMLAGEPQINDASADATAETAVEQKKEVEERN